MSRRKQKHHSNHERWLISYADFITLLFAFFVVLYATSKADQKKQAEVAAAINSAFQSLGLFQSVDKTKGAQMAQVAAEQTTSVSPKNASLGDQLLAPAEVKQDFERMKKRLEGVLAKQIADHVVALHIGREGLVITLREAGFYDSGSAIPHPSSTKTLSQIADVLRTTPYDIRIEGHTDNVPIHTEMFDSNWELSTARATYMAKLFIVNHHFEPMRLSASGYAEFHPTTSNATADGRAQNRRVDIIVLPRVTIPQAPAVDMKHAKPDSIPAALPVNTAQAAVTKLPSVSR
jgi:chemotaxis protein MotB